MYARFSLEIHSYCVRVVGGLVCRAKPNVLTVRWLPFKNGFKKCAVEKNKKHWVGLRIGSKVLLKYGLYAVRHLSKWYTFSSLFNGHFLLCRVVIRLHITEKVFAKCGLLCRQFQRKTEQSKWLFQIVKINKKYNMKSSCD